MGLGKRNLFFCIIIIIVIVVKHNENIHLLMG